MIDIKSFWQVLQLYAKIILFGFKLAFWYCLYLPTYLFWCLFGRKECIEDYDSLNYFQDKMIKTITDNIDIMAYIMSFGIAKKILKVKN